MSDNKAKGTNKSANKRDLIVSRVFDAPVEQVWKAWTDPKQVMQWWGPDGFTSPSAKIDFRENGISLVCMRAPKECGGQDMYSTWAYSKIVPMQSIEYIHNLADQDGRKADSVTLGLPPDFPQDQRNLVSFKAAGDNKTEMTVTEYDWTVGQMLALAEIGLNQCLDKMEASFTRA
ncbi:MAG TPA: SRPBCC domain-containing protein [Burkholderiaceae bacterium]|nr:SRPBCC domain-containing protein [Burkholderiaceae bacterium]